jgi:hypothetical protein
MMSDRSYSGAESRRALVEAFRTIGAYKSQAKEIANAIRETKEAVCAQLNIAPKGFDVAMQYWGMTEGERMDLDTVLTMAQQALSDMQPDLFASDSILGARNPRKRETAEP